jgi:hypothetical protein
VNSPLSLRLSTPSNPATSPNAHTLLITLDQESKMSVEIRSFMLAAAVHASSPCFNH